MKIAHKVGIAAATVLFFTTGLLSLTQVGQVRDTLRSQTESSIAETSATLARQIEGWLNAKLRLIDLAAQTIDSNYSPEENRRVFGAPLLKDEFILVFGTLEADGRPIGNLDNWKPSATWDGRQRPWYATGKNSSQAVLTEPYVDSTTGELLISAVARISDAGRFLGVFGGDIRLQRVADAINTLDFNGAGHAFLLNRTGKIISHPRAEMNGKPYAELFDGASPALDKALREVSGGGKDLFVSFTPLSNLQGMDWYIGVVLDKGIVMAEADRLTWMAAIGTAVGVVVSLVLLIVLVTRLLRPLGCEPDEAAAIMEKVANGDLTTHIAQSRPGSLLHTLGNMVVSLRGMISEIHRDATQLASDAQRIANASDDVASAAEQQSDATASMAAAIEELTVSSSNISDSARETAQDSVTAVELSGQGAERVGKASQSIQQIASTVADASTRIRALEERARQISDIANVIKEIAGQTNLLALNAAIEAARAGEQGRGFAVVADEVRKLAERTSTATTEIEQMIVGIQSDTVGAVDAMDAALPEVRQGVELAGSATEALHAIEQGARRTLERIGDVANATTEQSAASTAIAQRVEQIAKMVEETAGTIQNTATTAHDLQAIATSLQALISRFRI
ncbi:methyl-accepting chemotaxis protein [Thauera butanivorans]|uniref:methyl-accepting chemotaxis protein n=1 Tax=Thauera butanivorans TaxID=86174 RepID=UPI000838727D|nr:methyl-accepting chemotaxis protein [Thauera butanivorans]